MEHCQQYSILRPSNYLLISLSCVTLAAIFAILQFTCFINMIITFIAYFFAVVSFVACSANIKFCNGKYA